MIIGSKKFMSTAHHSVLVVLWMFISSALLCAGDFVSVNDSVMPDKDLDALLAPYCERLDAAMSKELIVTSYPLSRGRPTARLNNLVADSLLWKVRMEFEEVDCSVTNYGGIRTSMGSGPITVGEVYEISPFDNAIVILELTGEEVIQLAHQIARTGGEPVSNLSFRILGEAASAVHIGGVRVDPAKIYQVATIDYLAGGNGPMPALWNHAEAITTAFYQRDALLEYLGYLGKRGMLISAEFEPRIAGE